MEVFETYLIGLSIFSAFLTYYLGTHPHLWIQEGEAKERIPWMYRPESQRNSNPMASVDIKWKTAKVKTGMLWLYALVAIVWPLSMIPTVSAIYGASRVNKQQINKEN